MTKQELSKRLTQIVGQRVQTRLMTAKTQDGKKEAVYVALYGNFTRISDGFLRSYYNENLYFSERRDEIKRLLIEAGLVVLPISIKSKFRILVEVKISKTPSGNYCYSFADKLSILPAFLGRSYRSNKPFKVVNFR